eukprot:Anaeramoba_flamelloidesa573476_23.p1 GENE.a573476_23~~a573476_23.p1  ORF type:complete len:187 (+),score=29.80 a573476_23:225-785(+)
MNAKTLMSDTTLYRNWHLAATEHDVATTEFEWALLRFHEAFQRFCLQLGSTCGLGSLTYQELIILHVIRMQDRPKPVTIIARLLNRDDIPNIQYSLRKLVSQELITKIKEPQGKIYTYAMTDDGKSKVDKYATLRATLLTEQTASIDKIDEKLVVAARLISLLTGIYDEAGRISATYSLPEDIKES